MAEKSLNLKDETLSFTLLHSNDVLFDFLFTSQAVNDL